MKFGPVDLRESIERVFDVYQPQAEASNIRLHAECDGQLVGEWDSLAIDQIIGNLLSNAIKFGDGSQVVVAATSCKAGLVTVSVSDGGMGIAPADQKRLFQRFDEVLATADASKGGFGLGLWLTRQLVEAHGGSITVRSTPGTGSTFLVELPTSQSKRQAPDCGGAGGVDRRTKPDGRSGASGL